jgi:hypothetical protein
MHFTSHFKLDLILKRASASSGILEITDQSQITNLNAECKLTDEIKTTAKYTTYLINMKLTLCA